MIAALKRFATYNPARLRAIYTAATALAATLGITIPAGVDVRVTGVLSALALILPLLQGEVTRAKVTPVAALPGLIGLVEHRTTVAALGVDRPADVPAFVTFDAKGNVTAGGVVSDVPAHESLTVIDVPQPTAVDPLPGASI